MLAHVSSAWIIGVIVALAVIRTPVSIVLHGTTEPVLQFENGPDSQGTVQALGLDPRALARFKNTNPGFLNFAQLLAIYTWNELDQAATTTPVPVLGTYVIGMNSIRFAPRFPWTPGLSYRARLNLYFLYSKYSSVREPRSGSIQYLEIHFAPQPWQPRSSAVVTNIYPSSNRLPANLLRMYIHFSAPMSAGHAYEHIHLLDEFNREISRPFLVLDQEMWDTRHMRLTLLFDPGRIKRGLRSNADLGPALTPGRRYHVVVDAKLLDTNGSTLSSSFEKTFDAVEPARGSPDYKQWKLIGPRPGSIEPLRLIMNQPMDHALLERMIAIYHCEPRDRCCEHAIKTPLGADRIRSGRTAGGHVLAFQDILSEEQGASNGSSAGLENASACCGGLTRIDGRIEIPSDETEWRFIPKYPWEPGDLRIVIDPALEDPAGNNLNSVFDEDLSESASVRVSSQNADKVVLRFNLDLPERQPLHK